MKCAAGPLSYYFFFLLDLLFFQIYSHLAIKGLVRYIEGLPIKIPDNLRMLP